MASPSFPTPRFTPKTWDGALRRLEAQKPIKKLDLEAAAAIGDEEVARALSNASGRMVAQYVDPRGRTHENVSIRDQSLDDAMRSWYGDDYGAIREQVTSRNPLPIEHPFSTLATSKDDLLKSPLYYVRTNAHGSVASGIHPIIQMDMAEIAKTGDTLTRVMAHEEGHKAHPMLNLGNLVSRPDGLSWIAAHANQADEVPADVSALMRLEYGVTGNKMRTPADRIRAVQGWMSSRPRMDPEGLPRAMYPYDPVMQHGPRAGNKAEGYDELRDTFRRIMERATQDRKREVIDDLMPHLMQAPHKTGGQHA